MSTADDQETGCLAYSMTSISNLWHPACRHLTLDI